MLPEQCKTRQNTVKSRGSRPCSLATFIPSLRHSYIVLLASPPHTIIKNTSTAVLRQKGQSFDLTPNTACLIFTNHDQWKLMDLFCENTWKPLYTVSWLLLLCGYCGCHRMGHQTLIFLDGWLANFIPWFLSSLFGWSSILRSTQPPLLPQCPLPSEQSLCLAHPWWAVVGINWKCMA